MKVGNFGYFSGILPVAMSRHGAGLLPFLPGSFGAADNLFCGDPFGLFVTNLFLFGGPHELFYPDLLAGNMEILQNYHALEGYPILAPLAFRSEVAEHVTCKQDTWHGPSGGHDQYSRGHPQFFDLLVVLSYLWDSVAEFFLTHELWVQVHVVGTACTLFLIYGITLVVLLMRGLRYHAGAGKSKATCAQFRVMLALAVLTEAGAVRPPPTRMPFQHPRPPRQTDLELWASGQLTMREQLVCSWSRALAERPLEHSSGEAAPPRFTASADEAQALLDETNQRRAVHITIWLATPYYEEEVLDIGIAFPVTRASLARAVYHTSSALPSGSEEIVFTTPRLGHLFASCVAIPRWLHGLNKFVLVLDSTGIGGATFAFYHEGPVVIESLQQLLPPDEDVEDVEFYVFGQTSPLGSEQALDPVQGGLIKAIYKGASCLWSDGIDARLLDEGRWNPRAEIPSSMIGRYVVYQSTSDQVVFSDYLSDEQNIVLMAEQLLNFDSGNCWIKMPEAPLAHLSHAGRNITKQIAVVEGPRHTPMVTMEQAVVFLDLRELGLFPQWVYLEDGFFDPTAFLDDIRFPAIEGWTVIVEGGDPCRPPPCLEARDGETLRFFLREGAGSSSLEDPDSDDSGPDDPSRDDDNDSDSSDARDMFDSSEFSGSPVPDTGAPRGPPPPQPVDRSRSPRRRQGDAGSTEQPSISLAHLVQPPTFDLTDQSVELPCDEEALRAMSRPWPPDWLQADISKAKLKGPTKEQLKGHVHWSDLLANLRPGELPEAHIYTDGAWNPKTGLGGYAVAIILVLSGAHAIFGLLGEQVQGNTATPWTFHAPPALRVEQIALATSLLWILQGCSFLRFESVTVHFDCLSAGWSMSGQWGPTNSFGLQTHALEQYLQELAVPPPVFRHVAAHKGHPYNELVDSLAKQVAVNAIMLPCPPLDAIQAFVTADLTWLGVIARNYKQGGLPIQPGYVFRWSVGGNAGPAALTPEQLIPIQHYGQDSPDGQQNFEIKVLSLNAQSLSGKHRYFEEQLDALNCNVALFQETKGLSSVIASKSFLRLATDGASHWGVAVWVSRKFGLLSLGGRARCIDEADIRIVCESPRLLILAIDLDGRKIVVYSGHCPHSAKGPEAKEFLARLRQHLAPLKRSTLIVGGLDLNGRVVTNVAHTTGGLCFGEEDAIGSEMTEVAQELQLWFPSTFERLHVGEHATYQQANGAVHRIDYVLLGGAAEISFLRSWVHYDFDTASPNDDHWPVMVDMWGTFPERASSGGSGKAFRPSYDTSKLLSAEGRRQLEKALQAYVQPSWHCDPSEHCQHLQDFLHEILRKYFTKEESKPRADYIPGWAWELRAAKLRLKARTRHRAQFWAEVLPRAFLQWRDDVDYQLEQLVSRHGLLYDLAASAIRFATARIRKGIDAGKSEYLRGLALVSGNKAGEILRAAKKAGIGGRAAKQFSRPLPLLLDASGQPAATREDRDHIWLDHFGKQEFGETISTQAFLGQDTGLPCIDEDLSWRVQDLPTFFEVEAAFRRAPRSKAVGLDGLPGELLASAPTAMARTAYPLLLKAAALLRQPIQWRGGLLQEMWKRSGSQASPDCYRSIFISSHLGKSYHKLLRERAAPFVSQSLHGMHFGAKRRTPVTFPALYVQGHLRHCRKRGLSSAVLFLDTHAAYYRVIRELSVGNIESDAAVCRIFHFFDIDPSDVREFMEEIKQGGLMAQAGLPGPLRHQAKDLLHHSWFITRYGDHRKLCATRAGSRPGESWADVIFAFVLGRILAQVTELATGEGLLAELCYDMDGGPFVEDPHQGQLLGQDCTWADDCAFPQCDRDPEILMAKATRLASLVLDYVARHGMKPNLKAGKTALMLALRGRGAHKARQKWFPKGARSVHLKDLDLRVQVAPQYVHLGGLVDPEMHMKQEARRRVAMATSAYKSGSKLLFANTSIPLDTRASLFQTYVGSTFFNLALWIPSGPGWDVMDGGYTKVLQGLLAKQFKGDAYYKLVAPATHIITGSWPLGIIARRARLSLLSSMAAAAPEALWAMVQTEQSWLQAVREDLAWLTKLEGPWPPCKPFAWAEWVQLFVERRGWIKRRVTAGCKSDFLDFCNEQRTLIILWALYRRACSQLPASEQGSRVWHCRPCGRSVRSKGALGAHFFKVHGRTAKYRNYVAGTLCQACGRQYWSRTKLAIHLRDSARCVQTLREHGLQVDIVAPGMGSRLWRKHEIEDYTLAVPEAQAQPLCSGCTTDWDATLEEAYRAICQVLQQDDLPASKQAILAIYQETLAKFPLYFSEAADVVERSAAEAGEIWDSGSNDNWTEDTIAAIRAAAEDFPSAPWPTPDAETACTEGATTLRAFSASIAQIDWCKLASLFLPGHETPNVAPVTLIGPWEAVKGQFRGAFDVTAVTNMYWPLVPSELQKIWDLVLAGQQPAITATQNFWSHPISLPFRQWRSFA